MNKSSTNVICRVHGYLLYAFLLFFSMPPHPHPTPFPIPERVLPYSKSNTKARTKRYLGSSAYPKNSPNSF